jgi:thiol:disulfide interchange protein DsbC
MIRKISVIVIFMMLCGGCAMTASKHQETKKFAAARPYDADHHALTTAEAGKLLKHFGKVTGVKPAPIKGLYEVTLRQGNRQMAAYIDFSKKHILAGRIYDIASRKMITPLPTEVPVRLSKAQLDKIKPENSILMGNPKGTQRMFVFTDPDCPYCKRLYGELKKLMPMEPDLSIYIKMYPLKMHYGAYDKARVILAAHSLDMLDKAFAGGKLPPAGEKDRKQPIDETIKLAESLGIRGTPAMVFPDGRLVIGFRSAGAMHALLTPPAEGAAQ